MELAFRQLIPLINGSICKKVDSGLAFSMSFMKLVIVTPGKS